MLSPLDLYLLGSFVIGTVIVVVFALRAGDDSADCTIARVLYDAEHSEKRR